MARSPRVLKDLVIVAALVRFVAEKVDRIPAQIPARLAVFDLGAIQSDIAEGIRLVPAAGEDVKRDLAADREGEAVVMELFLESRDKRTADVVNLVVVCKFDAFFDAASMRNTHSERGLPQPEVSAHSRL